jgi:hypothetical protein
MRLFHCASAFVLAFVLSGCQAQSELPSELDRLGRANAPPLSPQVMNPVESLQTGTPGLHRGAVLEAIDVPNYTYLRLKTDQGEVWAAIPSTKVEVGQSVEVIQSLIMTDFQSKTLGRTFPSIVFGVLKSAGSPDAGASPDMALPPGHPPIE